MLKHLRGTGKRTKFIWWVLIIVTVVTFLGGFVFIFGSGLSNGRNRAAGAVATVNGEPISRTDLQNAINEQRSAYVARYGDDPGDREMQTLSSQAFRTLVVQQLMEQKATQLGLKAHDREVLLQLQTSPPPEVMNATNFKTNGQFDINKYRQAMADPNNDWSAFEERVRQQLPVRKLQERLFTSVKITEPQVRQAYRDLYERVDASIAALTPDPTTPPPNVTDADLQRAYDQYKSRFWTGPQRQLEVLIAPKQFGDAEVKAASDLAKGLVDRLRRGENYIELSRQYSDASGADKGGVIDRVLQPQDFGADLGPKVALMDTGQVTDPVRDGGRFLFFRINERAVDPQTGRPGVKVAEFVIRVKGDDAELRKQYERLDKLRGKAQRDGLGRAAVAEGLTTVKTPYFDLDNPAPQLQVIPEATDWAFSAKLNEVSPVLEGTDHFGLVQLSGTKEAGPMPKDQLGDALRQIAQVNVALDRLKGRADSLGAAIKSGESLEQAAAKFGLTVQKVQINRLSQDPRLAGAPELVGALFATPPGQVVGPVRTMTAYLAARVDQKTEPNWAQFDSTRQQISQSMLETLQRRFLENYASYMRSTAKVKDMRSVEGY